MPFTPGIRNAILDSILRGTAFPVPAQVWASLHTADPGTTGANELPNAEAYARIQVRGAAGVGAMTAAAAGASSNSTDLLFAAAGGDGWAPVTHVGLWDDTDADGGDGTFLGGFALTTPRTAGTGVGLRIAPGDLDVTAT